MIAKYSYLLTIGLSLLFTAFASEGGLTEVDNSSVGVVGTIRKSVSSSSDLTLEPDQFRAANDGTARSKI